MLFVFISHFGYVFFSDRAPLELRLSEIVGMVASPTFMVISGAMLGFLYSAGGHRFAWTRIVLMDRGLFLLTVGHLLIALAHWPMSGTLSDVLRWGFITDAIGLSIVVAALLITQLNPKSRLALAVALYSISWAWANSGQLEPGLLLWLRDSLVGHIDGLYYYYYNFPLLSWFSLYLASTVLGERIARIVLEGGLSNLARYLFQLVALGVIAVTALVACREAAKAGWLPSGLAGFVTYPFQKHPPAPAYFLTYATVGLTMLACLVALERNARLAPLIDLLATVGRNSLIVFVAQYFLFYTALYLLKLPMGPHWPFVLLGCAAIMIGVAVIWDRLNGNRFLTVGLQRAYRESREVASA